MSRLAWVERTYLELRSREQLRAARAPDVPIEILRRSAITAADYRRLYRAVGARWHWTDRDAWTDEQLGAHLAQANVAVWECMADGVSSGYFELVRGDHGAVEIAYFGLVPECIGRGIGGALLARAATEAWAFGATRVWLHTCTLDSPRALPNYRARGFSEVRRESYATEITERSGADREHSALQERDQGPGLSLLI